MQLLKYLQAQGLGSRKTCQWLINSSGIRINGHVCDNAKAEIEPDDVHEMFVHDEAHTIIPLPFFYIVLHKPADYETSHKPKSYASVFSLFPDHMRNVAMQAIGRLDADTTGVLLITNDGQFNHRMTSPKRHISKLYQVTLKHPADDTLCQQLMAGVLLHDDNETVAAAQARLTDPNTLLLTITEGKYHQVKRMVAAAGNRVEALHRLSFDHWTCSDLAPGEWRFIQPKTQP